MTTVILVRHGHVEGIRPARFRGRRQIPLSEQGQAEAELTARRIACEWRPAAIHTSTMQRSIATGAAIGLASAAEPIATADLDDLDYGDWQWKTHEDVKQKWPHLYAQCLSAPQFVRFPNGESLQDIVLRSANALRRVVEGFPTAPVVLVGHDSVNRALLLQLLDQPLSAYWLIAQDPCAITVIEIEGSAVRALSVNDTSHLHRTE